MVVTFVDITRQKTGEEALRQSEERLRRVAETVPDILFRATADGRIDFVNHQFQALTGRAPEAVLGSLMWPDLVHPDDRERTVAAWDEAREKGDRLEIRHRLLTDDGSCWVITRARPSYRTGPSSAPGESLEPAREEAAVMEWFGTVTDIDALVRSEEELHRLNATLEERVAKRTLQVRKLSARLTHAEQEERRRIALVLHDDLQQQLAGLAITLRVLWTFSATEEEQELRPRPTRSSPRPRPSPGRSRRS